MPIETSQKNLNQLLLAYYGDDFTGSTDAMEALTRAGVPTMLFVEPPTATQLEKYPDVRAVGVAGVGRSLSPDAMRETLPPIFQKLKALGAPIFHYKTCSTFDSAPHIGSIGCAIDLAQDIFQSPFVPLVVGVPTLGRFVAFGNLFARFAPGSEAVRLDRHPNMRVHPVTPMDEADLRRHLAKQTAKSIALFDALQLQEHEPNSGFARLLETQPAIVLFDTLYEAHLPTIGELIWSRASSEKPIFAVGSSGVEYALTAHWRQAGILPEPPQFSRDAAPQIIVVSGSCSPVTARQIEWAIANGFAEIALDTVQLLNNDKAEIARVVERSHQILRSGRSPLLHTARGPHDARLQPTNARLQELGGSSSQRLGAALGQVLRAVWQETSLPRAVVTGGDTSGYVAHALGIEALTMSAPAAPGAPLCQITTPHSPLHGREIVFKGGQVGGEKFFGELRD